MPSFTPLLLALASIALTFAFPRLAEAAENAEKLSREQCLVELDSTVAQVSNETRRNLAAVTAAGSLAATIDRQTVDAQLGKLEKQCLGLPQFAHNRGVLAALSERWPEAIAHFERSLQQDARAADSYHHLQQIYEYRAMLAYANALETPVKAPLPTLEWQDSGNYNSDYFGTSELISPLRSVSTLEYELFDWWQSLQNEEGLLQHYVEDFSENSIQQSREHFADQEWQDMDRLISFTAQDAVAVISDAKLGSTLLLLRLEGTRWKIYQESRL